MKGLGLLQKAARYTLWLFAKALYLTYLVIFRSFLYVLTLFCVVYFTVNSSVFLPILHPVLDEELPGAIVVESLQWGPLPWQTRIIGVDITDPDGVSVITADKVYAEVDLSDLFSWIIPELGYALFDAHWHGGPTAFHIRITRAEVYDYMVLLDFMNGSEPTLARAFDDGLPSVGPSRGPAKVEIPYAFGTRGRCVLVFPDFRMDYGGIEFRNSSVFVENGYVTVETPEVDVATGVLDFDPAISPVAEKPWQIPITRFHAKGFYLRHDYFDVANATATVGASSLQTFGSLYFRADEPTSFKGEALLQLSSNEPLTRDVLGNWAKGGAEIWLSGNGQVETPQVTTEIRSPALEFNGLLATDLIADARLLHPDGGFALALDRFEAGVASGRVNLTRGWFQPARGQVHFDLALAAISPIAILSSPLVGLPIEEVLVLDGALSGRTQVQLDYDPANITVSAAIGPNPLVWDRGNAPLALPLESTVEWTGNLQWTSGRGHRSLYFSPVVATSGGSQLWAMGEVDLTRNLVRAWLDVDLPDFGNKMALLGRSEFEGSISVTGAEINGPLLSPDVLNASVKGRTMVTPWLGFDSLAAKINLIDGRLTAEKLNIVSNLGTIGLNGSVQLLTPSIPAVDPDLNFEANQIRATAFPLETILPTVTGRLDLSNGKASGSLHRIESIAGNAQVVLTDLGPLPERIDGATGSISISKGRLRVSDAKLAMPAAEAASVKNLEVDLKSGRFTGSLAVSGLTLEQSRLVQTANLPLFGTVTGEMWVQNGEHTAQWQGRAKTTDLRFDSVILGDAELVLTPSETPYEMAISAASFFWGAKLTQPSILRIGTDGLPERLLANAAFENLSVDSVLPFLAVKGLQTQVTGSVEVDLDFRPQGSPPKIVVTTPPNGATATWNGRNMKLVAETQAQIAIGELGRIDVSPVLITSGNRKVSLCGSLLPDKTLEISIQLASPLDFWGLERDMFAMLDGQVQSIQDEGRPKTDPKNTCFYKPFGDGAAQSMAEGIGVWPTLNPNQRWVEHAGAIRIFGELKNPLIDGRLTFGPLATRPRGLADEIRLDPNDPWILDLWTDVARNKIVQRLGSPADRPWKGTLGEGSFSATVSAMLRAWELEETDIRLAGVGIDYVSGDNYRFKFTTDMVAKGRRLSDVGRRKLDLSGKLTILDGTYATGTRAAQDVFGRTAAQRKISNYSKSLLESAPWLGPVALNVNIAGSNFLVRMALPVGETDVELRIDADVRGTIADPELVGRIDALPGGLLTNTIVRRELEIIKAIADFSGDPKRPMLDTETRAEVTFQEERSQDSSLGLNQVWSSFSGGRAEEKTVVIRIVVRGPVNLDRPGREFADLEVDLTADGGGYERSELLTLLLTGAPPGLAEDGQEYGAAVNVVTDELAGVLAQTLLGAFVDGVQVGVTLRGGVDWALQKSLGRGLKFEVRGSEEASKRLVQPRFEFRLSDRLSLEGSLRYQQGQDFAGQTYETKLRYRIPLD